MNLVRWEPYRELEEMADRLNRMFGRQEPLDSDGKERMTRADWMPVVDISEKEDEFEIKAELPGVQKEDVKITLERGVLTLQGERKQEQEEKDRRIHRIERSYGHFLRSFTLPDVIDETKVQAEYREGILRLRLPKSEKARPKAIEVHVA